MIDFSKNPIFKLAKTDVGNSLGAMEFQRGLLLAGEEILNVYSGGRDCVIFTNKRVVAINVQGLTGSKKDFTSIPYSKIQAFSVETAGAFDRDAEMELCISGLGKIKFEFSKGTDVAEISRILAYYTIK